MYQHYSDLSGSRGALYASTEVFGAVSPKTQHQGQPKPQFPLMVSNYFNPAENYTPFRCDCKKYSTLIKKHNCYQEGATPTPKEKLGWRVTSFDERKVTSEQTILRHVPSVDELPALQHGIIKWTQGSECFISRQRRKDNGGHKSISSVQE